MKLLEALAKYEIQITGINHNAVNKKIQTPEGNFSAPELSKLVTEKAIANKDWEIVELFSAPGLFSSLSKEVKEEKSIDMDDKKYKVLENLKLYKDISFSKGTDPEYFLYHEEKKLVSPIPAHHYIAMFEIKKPELDAVPVLLEYNPRGEIGETAKNIVTGDEIAVINSYVPAKWAFFEEDLPDELPAEFKTLVWHIFPKAVDREYFFNWVYKSITARAETYLVLQGAGAIGKNRLKIHLRALHGYHNSADGKKSTLTGTFNSQLLHNTLVYFDELRYSEEEENVMKEIPNGTISIEGKFKDSTKASRIHCSLVIANNRERDNFISFDSRKFVPLEMTNRPLTDVMTEKEISVMSAKVEFEDTETYDIKYVAQIGRWILKHGKSKKWPNCEYRGPRLWALAHSSMPLWQKKFIEHIFMPHPELAAIAEQPKIKYSIFHKVWESKIARKDKSSKSNIRVDFKNVEHFFNIFRDLNGDKIFEVSPIPGVSGDFYFKILKKPVLGEEQEEEIDL